MNSIVEDHSKNQFAKGQSSRDLRASSDGVEQETQLKEAITISETSCVTSRLQRE
jgi:hypothetical protein